MTRKNIKLPEALFEALRDDKNDSQSWPHYFEQECLHDGGGEGRVDSDALAREVAGQLDYAELATSVADELEGRMR